MEKREQIVAFIDLGTNSARLLVVRINDNYTFQILTLQKEQVRLGEGEFAHHTLHKEAIERALVVLGRFVETAQLMGASSIQAVATAATREASNQNDFIRMFHELTGEELHVISGKEEARLIFLGVTSGINLGSKRALSIDIGGGSTEISLGTERDQQILDSIRLGAIRLTNHFLPNWKKAIPAGKYKQIRNYIKDEAIRSIQHFENLSFDICLGSSGTIETLSNIASLRRDKNNIHPNIFSLNELHEIEQILCKMTLEERKNVPGMNPQRVDIIISGMAILSVLMEELSINTITASERGLRDGLLFDHLHKLVYPPEVAEMSVRARSIMRLSKQFNVDETHAVQVSRLAINVFDELRTLKLIHLNDNQREILHWAGMLHDIGIFININNHHQHGYYIVKNSDILGFDQHESSLIAALVYFHKKGAPHRKLQITDDIPDEMIIALDILSLILRIAESLDRSHCSRIDELTIEIPDSLTMQFNIKSRKGFEVEAASIIKHKNAIKKIFNRNMLIKQID